MADTGDNISYRGEYTVKRIYFIMAAVALYFLISIGIVLWDVQNRSEVASQESNSAETQGDTFQERKLPFSCAFEGVSKTEDNPWGVTAGVIQMEETGEAIFLTPRTNCLIQPVEDQELRLEVGLHPSVRDVSDGANLIISTIGETDEIIEEMYIAVPPTAQWMQYTIHVAEKAVCIKLLCENGDNNDDSGDWVIVRNYE